MYGHPEMKKTMAEIFGKPIHTYTRAQAIADGILVDAGELAMNAGFCIPVALTRAVWEDCVAWSDADNKRQLYQEETGRLWDVLWMCSRLARHGGREIHFRIYRVPRGGRGIRPRRVALKAICGPGDQGEPVVTILLPDED